MHKNHIVKHIRYIYSTEKMLFSWNKNGKGVCFFVCFFLCERSQTNKSNENKHHSVYSRAVRLWKRRREKNESTHQMHFMPMFDARWFCFLLHVCLLIHCAHSYHDLFANRNKNAAAQCTLCHIQQQKAQWIIHKKHLFPTTEMLSVHNE